MKKIVLPFVAASLLLGVSASLPVSAQSSGLPSTSLGRVGVPGDNQYTKQTQSTRHQMPQQMMAAPAVSAGPPPVYGQPWTPAPKPYRSDPSIEPIAADEPISPNGFPPLPDRLELPVQLGMMNAGSGGGWGRGGGGGGGGGGEMSPGGREISRNPTGMKQHYAQYEPGAFMPNRQKQGGGGGGGGWSPGGGGGGGWPGGDGGGGGGDGGGGGVYRIEQSEHFSSGTPGGTGPGALHVAMPAKDGGTGPGATHVPTEIKPVGLPPYDPLRGLGKEPKLGDDPEVGTAPPQPVTVNQAVSQDLSLPEDDFKRKSTPMSSTSPASTAGRTTRRVMQRAGQRIMNQGMGAMNMMRF